MSELTNPTGTISSYQLMRWARQAAPRSWLLICRVLQSISRPRSEIVRDILGNSHAARLTSCICRMPRERFSNLMTAFWPTSVCAGPRSNTPCATAGRQCKRRSQIGRGVSNVTLPEPPRAKPLGRIDVRGPRQICHEYSGFPTEAGLP
jgi:hypothetical protein